MYLKRKLKQHILEGRGASGFYGSRILDKIGDGFWIFNFQSTGLWI